jgi:hypothetical protein
VAAGDRLLIAEAAPAGHRPRDMGR